MLKKVVDKAIELLAQDESFVQATIINQEGSAPRHAGSRMIICKNNEIIGSVGGGALEAKVQQIARQVFANRSAELIAFNLTEQDVAQMGMVCGGQGEILVDYIDAADSENIVVYRAMAEALCTHERVWLATLLPRNAAEQKARKQCVLRADGSLVGTLDYDPQLLRDLATKTNKYDTFTILEQHQILVESIGTNGTAYIFGGGHCGYHLVPVLHKIGFATVVLDDRAEFANAERFPTADQIIVVESFDNAMAKLSIDRDSYIIIVTRGHMHDHTVLRQALRTKAGYIGMIGSRQKREYIYHALRMEGFTDADLERVYSPIGLAIKAESPEEIAISIAAELIKIRAEKQ